MLFSSARCHFFSENSWLSKKYSFWALMLCGEFANIIKKNHDRNNATLLTNSTILHIYTSIFGTLGCTVFIQEAFFVHTRTHLHMHTPIHLHAQTHYSDAHTTCEKVSLRLLPKSHQKSSQSTLVLLTPPWPCFCSFRLLFYAIQNSTLPIFPVAQW